RSLLNPHPANSLDRTLERGLRARSAGVAAIVRQGDPGLREAPPAPVADATGSFAQVLDSHGTIRDQSPGLRQQPLLTGPLLRRAQAKSLLIARAHRLGGDVRLLAIPLQPRNQKLVLVVGAPLRSRDQTLANLRSELLVGGPAALLLASLIGYLVAGAALRPVERMRTRAAAITEQHLSERLPVPSANDEIARLGATLNQMLARVERAVKRERSFVADASHELRAPLALVRTEVDLALDLPRSAEEIQAADEGAGFDNGVADTAFERFTRGDLARSSGGAGLGLAIVKAIVAAHNGRVALSTDIAHGADVVLTLPATPALPDLTRDQHG